MCYGVSYREVCTNGLRSAEIEVLTHVAELLVARLEQILRRLIGEHYQLPVEHDVEKPSGLLVIGMRASFRFGHNLIDDAQFLQVGGRNFQGDRRRFRLGRIAPHNGRAAFRRNHGIETVLENIHAVADGYGQRAARSAFAGHGHNNRHRQAGHLAQVQRDRLRLAALLGVEAGVRALRIDKRKNRPAVFCGQLHYAQGFAIAFRLGLTEIAHQSLFGIAPLLVTDHRHGPPVKFRQAGDYSFVVAVATVAVHLKKISEQQSDEIQRIRALRMPRDLRALPRSDMRVEFAPQLRHLLANALEFRVAVRTRRKVAQLLDIFFQAVDRALASSLRRSLFSGAHHITSSMAWVPQICRTDSIRSAFTVTRSCACSTAIEPSGECSSKSTGVGPGEPANNFSRRSSVLSLSDSVSKRTRNSGTALRSTISSSRRASCNERRVPASSICTRAFNSSGVPGLRMFSSFAKLSGNASISCTPVMSCRV